MSSPPRRHLDLSAGREVVYCHACQNEWFRDEQAGIECPRCHGEITEIISPENDPRNLEDDGPDLGFGRQPPVFDNYHESDSDPEEDDIDQHVQATPNGIFMQRTLRPGGAPNPNHADPEIAVLRRFTDMLMEFNGGQFNPGQPGRSGQATLFPQPPPAGGEPNGPPRGGMPAFSRTTFRATPFGTATVTISTIGGIPGGRAGGPADFDAVFGNLMNRGPPGPNDPNGQARPNGQPPPFAASLHGLIAMLIDPAAAAHGDAVYSQEALDRIITLLMEQNPQSNAAPPASQEAIAKLAKRKVELEDLGSDGKAECTICIDELHVGDEVTVLPCKHWFHGECVTLWLKEHNTCPICRTPIEASNNANNNSTNNAGGRQQRQQPGQQQPQQPGQQQPNQQPPQRGEFDHLFGQPSPPPPSDMPDLAPINTQQTSRSRYERLYGNPSSSEERLNAIRNLGGASYARPGGAPSSIHAWSQQQQQQQQSSSSSASSSSQRRSSHSPPPEPSSRTPRVRSPSGRPRDPFGDPGVTASRAGLADRQAAPPMSGYDFDAYRRDRDRGRASEGGAGGRDREGERQGNGGPLSWFRDQWNRHSGSGGSGSGGGGSGSSGSGSGDRKRS